MAQKQMTTISLSKKTKADLKKRADHIRDTYEMIIEALIKRDKRR